MAPRIDLPGDYCFLESEGSLSDFERLTYVDESRLKRVSQKIGEQLDELNLEGLVQGFNHQQLIEDAQMYSARHIALEELCKHRRGIVNPRVDPLHGLSDGEIVSLSFESNYEPINPRLRDLFRRSTKNRYFRARWWRHYKEARPTIVAFHALHMGDQRINSLVFQPGLLYRLGFDVVLVELPFHGSRTSKEITQFPNADLSLLVEAIFQSIVDFQTLQIFLALEGKHTCGVLGISFGGYIATLCAALTKLSFCCGVAPIVSLSDTIHRIHGMNAVPSEIKVAIEKISALCRLDNRTPKTNSNDMMFIVGEQDHLGVAESQKQLMTRWGITNALRLSSGHGLQGAFESHIHSVADFLLKR